MDKVLQRFLKLLKQFKQNQLLTTFLLQKPSIRFTIIKWINTTFLYLIPIMTLVRTILITRDLQDLLNTLCLGDLYFLFLEVRIFDKYHDTFAECKDNLKNNFHFPWTQNIDQTRKSNVDNRNQFICIGWYSVFAISCTFGFLGLRVYYVVTTGNKITILDLWYPFDKFGPQVYVSVFIFEVYSTYLLSCTIVTIDLIYNNFITNLTAQFDIVISGLNELHENITYGAEMVEEDVFQQLKQQAIHHDAIIRWVYKTKNWKITAPA